MAKLCRVVSGKLPYRHYGKTVREFRLSRSTGPMIRSNNTMTSDTYGFTGAVFFSPFSKSNQYPLPLIQPPSCDSDSYRFAYPRPRPTFVRPGNVRRRNNYGPHERTAVRFVRECYVIIIRSPAYRRYYNGRVIRHMCARTNKTVTFETVRTYRFRNAKTVVSSIPVRRYDTTIGNALLCRLLFRACAFTSEWK